MLGITLVLSGCSAAAVQGASGLATSVESAVTGFETAGSQTRVNDAQVQLTLANAELVRNQALDLELPTPRPIRCAASRWRLPCP